MIARHAASRGPLVSRYGMWFFLYTELLLFGAMFLVYSVYRYRFPSDFHRGAMEENLVTGSINTLVLITSSMTLAMAVSAMKTGENRRSARLQLASILLGVVFLCIKYYEWHAKIIKGLYPNSPVLLKLPKGQILYFGLYYAMTGLHGLHLLAGIGALSFTLWLTVNGRLTRDNHAVLENTGLYWHFVDIVWMYLFPLFYLIT
ncbi:MAG: cytochrome c oxidase subunit 3 family protein [Nitrospiraceae bacterium]|nr:cytochrome c oxidase subunit 3 family protein [Nitrospiraceae bacterium]